MKSLDVRDVVGHHDGVAMHKNEIAADVRVVRRLVDEQFPQWADLPLREVTAGGTVNAIFRIGEGLAARFPLCKQRAEDVRAWLGAEAAAATELAGSSTVPVPEPVASGEPGYGYPMPWSVQTWVSGHDATVEDPGDSAAFAEDLADFIAALRATDTRGRVFNGRGRGGHLPDHDAWMATCFVHSGNLLDVPRLRSIWAELRDLPRVGVDVMSHADLTPANVLVNDGRLAGVLDTGGFAAADPALDLVSAWHLLDTGPRVALRSALECDEITWRRGMAWAFEQSMGLVWYYAQTHRAMSRWGRRTLDRLLASGELD